MTALPFIRMTAVAGIALVVAGFVLGIVGHDQVKRVNAAGSTKAAVEVGGLIYRASEARVLDPRNPDDGEILSGIPAARRPPGRNREWFGVFVSVYNPDRRTLPAAHRFVLVDLDGHRFRPERRLGDNAYVYRPAAVAPGRRYPPDASVAASNLTTEGALLLFRIPRPSYDFGSLTLRIADPAGRQPSGDLRVS